MPHRKVFTRAGFLLILSWFSLAFVDLEGPRGDVVMIGYFLGSLFAHATLAAAWTAFGPGALRWRLPLSLVWVISLPVAVAINIGINSGPDDAALTLGFCFLGQWLLLQLPLVVLARGFGLQLRHFEDVERDVDGHRIRFSIGHLMVVMAVTSVVLGLGRIIVPHLSMSRSEGPIFVFLAVAAVVVTLPLMLAALMRRIAIVGVLMSLVLIVVATAYELPLMKALGGNGPERSHFIAINAASAALILVIGAVVRMSGYCLFARDPHQQVVTKPKT